MILRAAIREATILAKPSPWPGRDDELRALWATMSLSQSDIAARMALSVGQIKGRAVRIGLPPRGQPSVVSSPQRRKAAQEAVKVEAAPAERSTVTDIMSFADHGRGCLWPLRDYRFGGPDPYCGAKRDRGDYCADHATKRRGSDQAVRQRVIDERPVPFATPMRALT